MNVRHDQDRTTVPAADMEPNPRHEPVAAEEAAGYDPRLIIRVISYRKLRHDPDGVSAKAVLDGLVHAGILADDSTQFVKEIRFESHQSGEERTVIEIY